MSSIVQSFTWLEFKHLECLAQAHENGNRHEIEAIKTSITHVVIELRIFQQHVEQAAS